MAWAGQQLGRAFAGSFGALASWETAVVQEELQQSQVVSAQMAPQEEVAPQAAVDILDQGTGPHRAPAHVLPGLGSAENSARPTDAARARRDANGAGFPTTSSARQTAHGRVRSGSR